MNRYRPRLPEALETAYGGPDRVPQAAPVLVDSYADLVSLVAQIAYHNPRAILLFRGQPQDFLNRGDSSTFYPRIYRGDHLPTAEVLQRFARLEQAEGDLIELVKRANLDGTRDIERRQLVRWSILQHYEVCPTPLLDLTHSLSVACSFAQLDGSSEASTAFVYAFAFPYLTHRISVNSEEDLVTVRLLSICPPGALRPFFQEGYLAGTTDVTTDFPDKSELDFKRRLLAKFEIPRDPDFWTQGFGAIPEQLLLPQDDVFKDLVAEIREDSVRKTTPGALGEFMVRWQKLEGGLLRAANNYEPKLRSVAQAIQILQHHKRLDKDLAIRLDSIRRFRNSVVHRAETQTEAKLWQRLNELEDIFNDLEQLDLINSEFSS